MFFMSTWQAQGKHDSLVFIPTLDALEKLLSRTRERERYKDSSVSGSVK